MQRGFMERDAHRIFNESGDGFLLLQGGNLLFEFGDFRVQVRAFPLVSGSVTVFRERITPLFQRGTHQSQVTGAGIFAQKFFDNLIFIGDFVLIKFVIIHPAGFLFQ